MNENDLTDLQKQVLDFLRARKRAVKRVELQREIFGTTRDHNNDRAIQRLIRALRLCGYVIVSNSNEAGYKLAQSNAEVEHYVAEQLKAAKERRLTALRVQKAYKQRGQMRLGVTG